VLSLEKDVPRLVDNAHAALTQPPLEVIATVEDWLAGNGRSGGHAVIRTKPNFVGKTDATGWTLFHSGFDLQHITTPCESGFATILTGKVGVKQEVT
jgi:hypothetical protein